MNDEERKAFGGYLKRLREEAGLSLRKAELEVGISNSYLYQIERGERGAPKMEVLRAMAKAYSVPLKSILAAAHLDDPGESEVYEDDNIERAFEFVRKDKRFQFGTHMTGDTLTIEAKRFIVEMYQRFTGLNLLDETAFESGVVDTEGE